MTPKLPLYDELPLNKNDPPKTAWIWGKDDEKGLLNLLTPENTVEAAKEIKNGIRVSLNWPMNNPDHALFHRGNVTHEIIPFPDTNGLVFDDTLKFNTQFGTQWDGFRHFANLKTGFFYNKTTTESIHGPNSTNRIGIQAWAKEGIVGRGVLLDFYSYAIKNNIKIDPLTRYVIKLDDLKVIVKEQNIKFKTGDILFIRTGFINLYSNLSNEKKTWAEGLNGLELNLIGIDQSEEVIKWIWDNHFAAIGSDAPSLEAWPSPGQFLHEVLLSGFGCPIGEMIYLDKLAELCKKLGRYTFFLTSEPYDVPGGVASPINALAIL